MAIEATPSLLLRQIWGVTFSGAQGLDNKVIFTQLSGNSAYEPTSPMILPELGAELAISGTVVQLKFRSPTSSTIALEATEKLMKRKGIGNVDVRLINGNIICVDNWTIPDPDYSRKVDPMKVISSSVSGDR